MYSIYCDGVCIHNDMLPSGEVKCIDSQLKLSENAAGSLEFTMPPGNVGYDNLKRMTSELIVYREKKEIWSGRVISEESDFWNQRKVTCEGELAYLNDTHQQPQDFEESTAADFLDAILTAHNDAIDSNDYAKTSNIDKHFYKGIVEEPDDDETLTVSTNYESTLDCITTNLVDAFGGRIRIRKVDGKRYLDYFRNDDYLSTSTQVIRFGNNLSDFTKNYDFTSFATVILPRGTQTSSDYVTVESATVTDDDGNTSEYGSIFVTMSDEVLSEYGWIEAVVDWSDIDDADELLEKAQEYLEDYQFDEMVVEVTAADLHYLSNNIEPINLLDKVQCISKPHGLNKLFTVTELTIPLDNPEGSEYTLGGTVTSSSGSTSSTITTITGAISSNNSNILMQAKENAYYILNQATNGHITITRNKYGSEALMITNTQDVDSATQMWKWDLNGLSYSSRSSADEAFTFEDINIAITMDGGIVANYITSGRLTTSKLNGRNSYFDLDKAELYIYNGGIYLGEATAIPDTDVNGEAIYETDEDGNYLRDANGDRIQRLVYPFQATDEGIIRAIKGEIGGFDIDDTGIENGEIRLDSQGIAFTYDRTTYVGYQGLTTWNAQTDCLGMASNLNASGTFLSWGVKDSSLDSYYDVKMIYTTEDLRDSDDTKVLFEADKFHINCPLDLHGAPAYNFVLDPNTSFVNGGMTLDNGSTVRIALTDSTGTGISGYFKAKIVNGFILGTS